MNLLQNLLYVIYSIEICSMVDAGTSNIKNHAEILDLYRSESKEKIRYNNCLQVFVEILFEQYTCEIMNNSYLK